MVIESLRIGGKERQALELFKALQEEPDLDVQVIVLAKKDGSYSLPGNEKGIHFVGTDTMSPLQICSTIYRFCRDYRPEVLHTWGIMPTLCSFPAAKLMKIKVLNASIRFAVRFKPFNRKWFAARLSYLFSNMVTANSIAGLRAQGLEGHKKCHVVYNGFDLERVQIPTVIQDSEVSPKIATRYVVGMVGSFNDSKDYKTFVNAASSILRVRKDVTFLCVGEGPNLHAIRAAVPGDYSASIHFTGKLDPVDSIERMLDVGVLACNTRGHAEGISNTIMEYMAFAKPVIATDSGGNHEIVEDQVTGFLVRAFSADELAAKIITLLDNEELRLKMGKAGRERIAKEFNLSKMAQGYLGLYHSMLHA